MIQDASRSRCLALILWVVLAHAPAEAQEGFSSYAGDLLRLRLTTDGSDVTAVAVGDPGVAWAFSAMALGPDGRLYGVSWAEDRLYAVDPESAAATLVGELDLPSYRPSDMTFDDAGQLWLLATFEDPPHFSTLFQVDHLTAAVIEIATGMAGLVSLGFHDGTFYGIVGDYSDSEYSLVSINPTTGGVTPIVELTGFEPSDRFCLRVPDDMDFDDQGRLWVAAVWLSGCVIIPIDYSGIHYYANPLDGILTSRSLVASSTGSRPRLYAFAVRGPAQPITEVPTLGFGGTLILATVLAALGLALARRRS